MTCRACGLDHKPTIRCEVAKNLSLRQALDAMPVRKLVCNQCVTKDEDIARLRNQIAEMESRGRAKPRRDRAAYMRGYRKDASKKPLGIPYG